MKVWPADTDYANDTVFKYTSTYLERFSACVTSKSRNVTSFSPSFCHILYIVDVDGTFRCTFPVHMYPDIRYMLLIFDSASRQRLPAVRYGRTYYMYCTYGREKITDVATLSFRWIIHFWYFCSIWAYKASLALYAQIKQKNQKWIIHRKLRVATSEGSVLFLIPVLT